jgi:hypothetical protein
MNLPLASANRISADADAPSYSSTLKIGFENKRIPWDIRLWKLHRRWNAYSSSIPQAMQIGSSIRPMLCRCLFNGQCPLMSPTKIFNLDLGILSKYLVKPGLGFFSHILDWRQAVSKLHKVQCNLNNHYRSLCMTLESANGRQGSGPTKAELDSALASASASSFPWIPQCPGTHTSWTLLDKASSWRESLHCSTTREYTAYDLRASKADWYYSVDNAFHERPYNESRRHILTFKMSENTPAPALPSQRDPSVKKTSPSSATRWTHSVDQSSLIGKSTENYIKGHKFVPWSQQ